VPQEYAVTNAPRVFLNPLSDEHQAMRGRGEGGDAHKLTGSITQVSQKISRRISTWERWERRARVLCSLERKK